MVETEITFYNKVNLKVQAQVYTDGTIVSTCVIDPDEVGILTADVMPYDVYFKNGVTGWEVARKLNSTAQTLTLSQQKGRYTIT